MAAHSHPHPSLVEDFSGRIKLYSDGSIVRVAFDPSLTVPPSEQPLDENGGVASKDVAFDNNLGLWVRIYLPPQAPDNLPLIIYFHGGGFVLFSPDFLHIHRLCTKWAAGVGAIIVSVGYRLAPEHRLPAAYEDSMAAVEWVRSQSAKKKAGEADPWLNSHADFSNAYLMGDASGGNIAHHVGIRVGGEQWEDLRIRGMILLQPFFGGQDRTASETGCPEGAILTLEAADKLWRLALPIGETRDHPFCNPLSQDSPSLADAVLPPLIVVIGGRELLCDRLFKYCEALKKYGKKIEVVVFDEEDHGFYVLKLEEESCVKMIKYASEFMKNCA